MKKYIFTETQLKRVIDNVLSEQLNTEETKPSIQNKGKKSNQVQSKKPTSGLKN